MAIADWHLENGESKSVDYHGIEALAEYHPEIGNKYWVYLTLDEDSEYINMVPYSGGPIPAKPDPSDRGGWGGKADALIRKMSFDEVVDQATGKTVLEAVFIPRHQVDGFKLVRWIIEKIPLGNSKFEFKDTLFWEPTGPNATTTQAKESNWSWA